MADVQVTVETGSRLHFGLLSFGNTEGRQYGGAGVIIDGEGVTLSVRAADRFEAVGPLSERVTEVVSHYADKENLAQLPSCRMELVEAPRHHTGLGTGTQLSLAVAAGLDAFLEKSPRDIENLVEVSGRGHRSAVGAYGFAYGGFIYEQGKLSGEKLSPLAAHVALPESWRFVLFCEAGHEGLSGEQEKASFSQLPPVPAEVTARLRDEIEGQMLPAATAADFTAFGESVYRYGCTAGECYLAEQGGIYASQHAEQLVDAIRSFSIGGIPQVSGIGQSSWGPTIFALTPSEQVAQELCDHIAAQQLSGGWTSKIVAVRNVGAGVQTKSTSHV